MSNKTVSLVLGSGGARRPARIAAFNCVFYNASLASYFSFFCLHS